MGMAWAYVLVSGLGHDSYVSISSAHHENKDSICPWVCTLIYAVWSVRYCLCYLHRYDVGCLHSAVALTDSPRKISLFKIKYRHQNVSESKYGYTKGSGEVPGHRRK